MRRELTDQELQTLRNMGNESEAAADEIVRLRAELDALKHGNKEPTGWSAILDSLSDK